MRACDAFESCAAAPLDPRDPLYGTTRRERKAALQQQLEQQYGPHAGDRDVRLYLKRRALNAARPRPSRRGGFPLDDSFDKPGTFLKLSIDFQRTVCECGRSSLSHIQSACNCCQLAATAAAGQRPCYTCSCCSKPQLYRK